MADTLKSKQYRDEYVAGFEQRQSLLRGCVTTEIMRQGNEAIFLVADSGDGAANTRGPNGLIPANADNETQYTATLVEWHDLRRKTRFNILTGQSDQRRIMQMNSMAVVNRKIDADIITELNTGTVNTGTAAPATLAMMMKSLAILGNNEVPFDGNIWGLLTPAALAYLLQTKEFSNAEYVSRKPLENADPAWKDQQGFYRWAGANWIVHPKLPGVGTSAEKCFLFHKSAIGHAADTGGMSTAVGYDDEQDYSYARCSIFMGSKLLQNSGVVVINHDGSALAAA